MRSSTETETDGSILEFPCTDKRPRSLSRDLHLARDSPPNPPTTARQRSSAFALYSLCSFRTCPSHRRLGISSPGFSRDLCSYDHVSQLAAIYTAAHGCRWKDAVWKPKQDSMVCTSEIVSLDTACKEITIAQYAAPEGCLK